MPINWILALKAVPWADVVQAAPHIVKGARKLFTSVRRDAGGTNAGASAATRDETGHTGVVPRLAAVEAAVESLRSEQCASAELIRSLAEQNVKVVEAMDILRARTRMLFGVCAILVVALVVVAVAIATR